MISILTLLPDTDENKKKKVTTLYHETVKPLYCLLTGRMGLSQEDAEDMMQEAYLYLYEHFDRLDTHAPGAVLSYLTCVCRSRYCDLKRSGDALNAAPGELDDRLEMADPSDIEREFIDADAVRECMSRLSEPERTLMIMIYYHGMSYAEIADLTGVSEGTLRKRHCVALKKMRKMMDDR